MSEKEYEELRDGMKKLVAEAVQESFNTLEMNICAVIEERFNRMDEKLASMETKMTNHFKDMEEKYNEIDNTLKRIDGKIT